MFLCLHALIYEVSPQPPECPVRGLQFYDGFGALGKVSLPSQYDSQFTSGLPLPGAQLRPKTNVGHTDMHF